MTQYLYEALKMYPKKVVLSAENFRNISNQYRRYKAHVSVLGTTQLHCAILI